MGNPLNRTGFLSSPTALVSPTLCTRLQAYFSFQMQLLQVEMVWGAPFAPSTALSRRATANNLEIVTGCQSPVAPGAQAKSASPVPVAACPEFISTSLTGAQSRPRGPRPGSSILTRPPRFSPFSLSPVILPARLLSLLVSSPHLSFSGTLSGSLCLWVFLRPSQSGFALPSPPTPRPWPKSLQSPGSG